MRAESDVNDLAGAGDTGSSAPEQGPARGGPRPDASRNAARWLPWLALLPVALLFVRRWSWEPPAGASDYAQYILHARALLDGRPYGDIGYLYHPLAWVVGPPVFPPGLPATLAPLIAVFGESQAVFRLFSILALCGFALVAYRHLLAWIEPWQAAAAAAFSAIAIESQLGTLAPMSDLPFCLLVWAVMLLADSAGVWSVRRVLAVTALGFAAIAFRTAGVALIPALFLFTVVRWREHGPKPAIPALIWSGTGALLLATSLLENPYSGGFSRGLTLAGRLDFLTRNYRFTLFEASLYPSNLDRLNDVYHVIAALLMLMGAVLFARRAARSFAFAFALAYAGMLAVSPFANVRYTWPLLPVMTASLVLGLTWTTARLGARPLLRALPAVLVAMVAVGAALTQLARQPGPAITGTPDSEALYEWLAKERAARPMRVMHSNPRVVTMKTGIPAMAALPVTMPSQLIAIGQSQITHIIWQHEDRSNCMQLLLNAVPMQYPNRFELVFENPTFRVYQVRDAGSLPRGELTRLRSSSAACREMRS